MQERVEVVETFDKDTGALLSRVTTTTPVGTSVAQAIEVMAAEQRRIDKLPFFMPRGDDGRCLR